MKKTTIILIRHGLTDWNEEGRWQGHQDMPLNATGRAQAKALGLRLASWPIQNLYCSDLKRAAQTAAILGEAVDLQPIHDPNWRERDVGVFQGLTWEEIAIKYPDSYQEMRDGIYAPPQGEDSCAMYARAVAAFDALAARHLGQMVAVVSHGGFLHTMLLYVLDMPIGRYTRLSLRGNTGINIVEISDGQPTLLGLNDTSHLEGY